MPLRVTQIRLIVLVATFIMSLHNFAYYQNFTNAYSDSTNLYQQLFSVTVFHGSVLILLLSLFGVGRFLKIALALLLVISASTAYFIDSYNVVIDSTMIENLVTTDAAEASDLMTLKMFLYIGLLGVLPAWLVFSLKITDERFRTILFKRLGLMVTVIVIAGAVVYLSGNFFASYFREQKILRYYTNPATPLYAAVRFSANKLKSATPKEIATVGTDAIVPKTDKDHELVVMVVGETARADHFSLNGYARETNPLLAKEDIVSFANVSSCGTSTATSVPCMFSFLTRENYDGDNAATTENVLDVLARAGVEILWRDNNSSSKGVADRIEYQNYKTPETNTICNPECRDEGMLIGLDQWIQQRPGKDVLVVLHQMGSHGPAYYKRYPPEFESFREVCESSQLEECGQQEIVNAYDNTILYTDYFLAKVIEWLKTQSSSYEVSMLYFSDHGESLGENGLFLHSYPYAFAPPGADTCTGNLVECAE